MSVCLRIQCFLLGVFALLCAFRAEALTPLRALADYEHAPLPASMTPPVGPVTALAEDGQGGLWIGGERGLTRFDGQRYAPPVLNEATTALHLLGKDLLIGTHRALLRLREGELTPVPGLNSPIGAMVAHGDGLMIASEMGLYRYRDGQLQSDPRLAAVVVAGLAVQGETLLAGGVGVVWRLSADGVEEIPFPEFESARFAQLALQGQQIVVGTPRGLYRYIGRSWQADPQSPADDPQVQALYRDRHDVLWAAFGQSLRRLTPITAPAPRAKRKVKMPPPASPTPPAAPSRALTARVLLEDRHGQLWLGAERLSRLRDSSVSEYPLPDGGSDGPVEAVATAPDGSVWFASSGGLYRRDGLRGDSVALPDSPGGVHSLLFTKNQLWLAGEQGLHRYRWPALERLAAPAGASAEGASGVWQAPDGTVWAATKNALLRFPPNGGSMLTLPLSGGRRITAMAASEEGLLFGSNKGLLRLAQNRLLQEPGPKALDSQPVEQLWLKDGRWYALTADSLFVRDGQGWHSFDASRGWPGGATMLLPLADGDFWLTSAHGLFHLPRVSLEQALTQNTALTLLPVTDLATGQGPVACCVRVPGTARGGLDANGDLWLPGPRLRQIHRAVLTPSGTTKPLLQAVSLGQQPLAVHAPLDLAADAAGPLRLQFGAPDLRHGDRQRYRYRLLALGPQGDVQAPDTPWQQSGPEGEAVFNDIAAGQYRLEIGLLHSVAPPSTLMLRKASRLHEQVKPSELENYTLPGTIVLLLLLYMLRRQIRARGQRQRAAAEATAKAMHDAWRQ